MATAHSAETAAWTLDDLIDREDVETWFQPIVSLKKKAVFGVEALSRGLTPSGDIIPPVPVFEQVQNLEQLIALDRLCRKKALSAFATEFPRNQDLILSLNIDARIISETVGSGHLYGVVKNNDIQAENVVIEISESRVDDADALTTFVQSHREYGFLIALDDVGFGHSNLNRIPMIKPDILKIDRAIITGIDTQYHKQEIAKSLVNLANKIGTLVVAEGVERLEEVLLLLEMGVDLFQGFYFARPSRKLDSRRELNTNIDRTARTFKDHIVKRINAQKQQHRIYNIVIQDALQELSRLSLSAFDAKLAELVRRHTDFECVYLLSETGLQISNTACTPVAQPQARRLIYQPAHKGTDHSLKEYYLPIRAGLEIFTTETYISLASGNLCKTISAVFHDADGKKRILCVDIGL